MFCAFWCYCISEEKPTNFGIYFEKRLVSYVNSESLVEDLDHARLCAWARLVKVCKILSLERLVVFGHVGTLGDPMNSLLFCCYRALYI